METALPLLTAAFYCCAEQCTPTNPDGARWMGGDDSGRKKVPLQDRFSDLQANGKAILHFYFLVPIPLLAYRRPCGVHIYRVWRRLWCVGLC